MEINIRFEMFQRDLGIPGKPEGYPLYDRVRRIVFVTLYPKTDRVRYLYHESGRRHAGDPPAPAPVTMTFQEFYDQTPMGKISREVFGQIPLPLLDHLTISEHPKPWLVTVGEEVVVIDRTAAQKAREKEVAVIFGHGFTMEEADQILSEAKDDPQLANHAIEWAQAAAPSNALSYWDTALTLVTAMVNDCGPAGWERQVAVIKVCRLPNVPQEVQGRAWKLQRFFHVVRTVLLTPSFKSNQKV